MLNEYKKIAESKGPAAAGDFVQSLPLETRIVLREALISEQYPKLVRTLWYCYDSQRAF